MNARFLMVVFDSVYLSALAVWVGGVAFFSFGVAPVIFQALGAETGGKFVRALFPRYYAWGAAAGSVALPASVAVPLCFPEIRGPWVAVQSLVIVAGTLVMLYAGNSLTPAINEARDAGPAGAGRFERLHRRSVRLNALVLVIGLALIVGFTVRPAPKTTGIVEPSPAERTRREMEYLRERGRAAPSAKGPPARAVE